MTAPRSGVVELRHVRARRLVVGVSATIGSGGSRDCLLWLGFRYRVAEVSQHHPRGRTDRRDCSAPRSVRRPNVSQGVAWSSRKHQPDQVASESCDVLSLFQPLRASFCQIVLNELAPSLLSGPDPAKEVRREPALPTTSGECRRGRSISAVRLRVAPFRSWLRFGQLASPT